MFVFFQGINISNCRYKLIWIVETNLKFTDITLGVFYDGLTAIGMAKSTFFFFTVITLLLIRHMSYICFIIKMHTQYYTNIFYTNSSPSCFQYPRTSIVNDILLYSLKLYTIKALLYENQQMWNDTNEWMLFQMVWIGNLINYNAFATRWPYL